ncbi:MAG: nucleotide exchange factor GrpE [Candidatus Paceibacterota bacterium]
MVNKNNNEDIQDDIEITTEIPETKDIDIETIEELEAESISAVKKRLKVIEEEKKNLQDELQRAKADFLNARKRLEDERKREYGRTVVGFIEELLPVCDSFHMAMSDKETWAKADANWRKGVEGIYAQLQNLLSTYRVSMINPKGEAFDPQRHEAITSVPVDSKEAHDTVTEVIQPGYQITHHDNTIDLVRPARVAIGNFESK